MPVFAIAINPVGCFLRSVTFMDYLGLIGKLSSSALASVGILAMLLPLFGGDPFFLLLFCLFVAANFTIILLMKNFSPRFFAQTDYAVFAQGGRQRNAGPARNAPSQNLGMSLSPLPYPQVHDEELRSFAPEFIRVDITGNDGVLFAGNLQRNVLRQFRDAIDKALSMRVPSSPVFQSQPPSSPSAVRPSGKKASK